MSAIEQDDFAAEEASHLMHAEMHEEHPELYEPPVVLDLGVVHDVSYTLLDNDEINREFEKLNDALRKYGNAITEMAATFTMSPAGQKFFDDFLKEVQKAASNPVAVKKLKGRERHLRAYRRRGQK